MMKVKIISVDTNGSFFCHLSDRLNGEIESWLKDNADVKLVSVTPAFHNVNDEDTPVAVMTATIIYE